MAVARATRLVVALLLGACRETPPARPGVDSAVPGTLDAAVIPRLSGFDAAAEPAPPTPTVQSDSFAEGLVAAYPSTALAAPEFDRLLVLARAAQGSARAALFVALARRCTLEQFPRFWSIVTRADWPVVARGLASRSVPGRFPLPPEMLADSDLRVLVPLTMAIQLLGLRPEPLPDPAPLLAASRLDLQIAGARLLSVRTTRLPDPEVLLLLHPAAFPALLKSLDSRPDLPPDFWPKILTAVAEHCRDAPRRWCNAWRAVRDAALRPPRNLSAAVAVAAEVAGHAGYLPEGTRARLHCDDAVALDAATGWPARSLNCAGGAFAWLSLWARASVLATLGDRPADRAVERAAELTAILEAAEGRPMVLEAVAKAAVVLPRRQAQPFIRRLAASTDPGVLAVLLEQLALHVQQAQHLDDTTLETLLRAPFQQPLAPSLEARTHAYEIAQALHRPNLVPPPEPDSPRALLAAASPDASVPPFVPPPAQHTPPIHVVFDTDAGPFELELHPEEAPQAIEHLLDAIRGHRYEGLTFHRVVPAFVVQGGDPRGDGIGGTEQITPTELSLQPFNRGAVGIPLAGLDTGGIQLFVMLTDWPKLDARYPWVGRVVDGMDTLDGLLEGDRILAARVLEPPTP